MMTDTTEALKAELSRLTPASRADLARYLIDSLDVGLDPAVQAAWEAELNRRWEQIRMGAEKGTPAEEVFQTLRDKHT
jgi:putative addiction module component (TIGR02574 family)